MVKDDNFGRTRDIDIGLDESISNNCGTCPECGSKNTGQSTYVDWCNDCSWSVSY